ncbi:GDSL-type esterase/lipase family protein [Kribbella sp.]|uniref:GDSL-type esterase/lipase family protein n=1 Tax=Kribbella sp. TaxID=1871183 RepID=UPI002D5F991B|nr:GDSL-type esterase/lipase family protein [Kribbella sp.]HZX02796.1 GDSL-type esterase/lipase family protein [Kribbella sp.]
MSVIGRRVLLKAVAGGIVLGGTQLARAAAVSPGNGNIRYLGRWQPQADGSVVGYYQSGLEFDFIGSSVSVTLGGTCRLLYRVDGGPVQRNITANGTVVMASGLSDGRHSIQVYSEYQQSFPRVVSFDVECLKPPVRRPTMEFIGDSISVGYIGPGLVNSLGSSFSYKTPELLGLSHNTVAFGGIATAAGSGSPDKTGMVSRYTKLSEYVPNETNVPDWDTSRYVPDYIVINLGTNDPSTGTAAPNFKPAYRTFLDNLRGYYPEVTIFAMSPFNTAHRDEIAEVVSATGDLFIDTTGWIDAQTETTDGTHPTIAAHDKIAGKLAAAIQQLR